MKRPVSYSKEMRGVAKREKRHLVTIDLPYVCFQGPVSKEQVDELDALLARWIEERKKK